MLKRFRGWLGRREKPRELGAVNVQVDDSAGWGALTGRPHDYDAAVVQELYQDALTARRKNPIAWRIIAITTDYVVGDAFEISSPNRGLAKFVRAFWHDAMNRMDLRLEAMCDELSRSGDLFVALFRNPGNGMSYLRFVTKDRIEKIETADNDWERETAFFERQENGEARRWLAAGHARAAESEAVMLHYSINRPLGALMGEGDLTTMIPWLLRYSRMLEDRVRLHWAMRAFLWLVTVPANRIREKQEQYRQPPESGSVIIKDESEAWEAVQPELHGADAQHDMKSVRGMIDAGSGYPPHWRGEAADANLATATAMQAPTERHLIRRQKYFSFILQDILYNAYQRAVQVGLARPLSVADYSALFVVAQPDISRDDNEALARSAKDLTQAWATLLGMPVRSKKLAKLMYQMTFNASGYPQTDEIIEEILEENRTAGEQ